MQRATIVGAHNNDMTVTIKVKNWLRYMASGSKAAHILNFGFRSCW
jgi:hypothetical protein